MGNSSEFFSMEVKTENKSEFQTETVKQEEHVCYICMKSFGWPSMLKKHMYKHTDDRPVMCETCNKSFKGEMQLKIHMKCKSHKRQIKILKLVKSGSKRNAHGLIMVKNPKIKHECKECGEVLGSITLLYEHKDVFHETDQTKKNKKCSFCPFTSSRLIFLNKHLLNIHGIKDHLLKCDLCDYETERSYTLENHKEVKHLGSRLSCDQCKFKARRKDELKNHKLITHLGFTFDCDQCSFSITSKKSLKSHKRMNHEDISCELCKKSFSGSNNLTVQKMRDHEGKIVDCTKCNFSSSIKKELEDHKKFMHPKTPKKYTNYRCDQCDFQTTWMNQLELHQKRHLKFESLSCPQCDSKFTMKKNLKIHIKLEHEFKNKIESFMEKMEKSNKQLLASCNARLCFCCKDCDFSSDNLMSISKHQVKHKDEHSSNNSLCEVVLKEEMRKLDNVTTSDPLEDGEIFTG